MSKPVAGHSRLAADIAAALGMKHCRSLEIKMEIGSIITVKAEFFPDVDGLAQLPAILKEYELHEKEKGDGESK